MRISSPVPLGLSDITKEVPLICTTGLTMLNLDQREREGMTKDLVFCLTYLLIYFAIGLHRDRQLYHSVEGWLSMQNKHQGQFSRLV